MLPGSNSRRGDSAFTTKSPNAPSSPQDEPTSTKELTSHWNANFAILLSLALMLMHLMTFTEHRFPSQKLLRQPQALLQLQALRRLASSSSSHNSIPSSSGQCSPLRSQTRSARTPSYTLCSKRLSKRAKHEMQPWQQSRHLKREFKSIKNLQKKSKSWLLRRQLYSRPQPSMNSVAQGEGMLANYAAQHCVSRHS